MPQLEHIEAIERRLWSAADTLRTIHAQLDDLNAEAVTLAATIRKNFEALGDMSAAFRMSGGMR